MRVTNIQGDEELARILFTGATGKVGDRLIPFLMDEGHTIIGVGRYKPIDTSAEQYYADLRVPRQAERIIHLSRPDIVIHAAGMTGTYICDTNPAKAIEINQGITKKIANVCADNDIPLIFFSTDVVYSQKYGMYAQTKLRAEYLIENIMKTNYAVIRLSKLDRMKQWKERINESINKLVRT